MDLQLKGNRSLEQKRRKYGYCNIDFFFLFQQSIFRMKNETVKTRLVTIFFYRLAVHS